MKCLYFDCYAGFDPFMVSGALIDMDNENYEIAKRVCGEEGFSVSNVTRRGMECSLLQIKYDGSREFVSKEKLISSVNALNISEESKNAIASMIDKLADATSVNPDDASFELSEIMPQLMASAVVLEIAHKYEVSTFYSTFVHTSSESGLFGSYTSPETSYLCGKYNIETEPLAVCEEILSPVGAALLAQLGVSYSSNVPSVIRCGYGAGKTDFAEAPNLLRAVLGDDGECLDADFAQEELFCDMTVEA